MLPAAGTGILNLSLPYPAVYNRKPKLKHAANANLNPNLTLYLMGTHTLYCSADVNSSWISD